MNRKQKQLYRHLRMEARQGKKFFKSKYIKEELDLSAKEVGSNIAELKEEIEDLKIEKWGYTKGTTWKIEIIEQNLEKEK